MKDLIIGYGVLGSALTLKEENVKHTNGSADYFYCLKILYFIFLFVSTSMERMGSWEII